MKLLELFKAVKEKSLTREQLESYRDELVSLFGEMQFELADIKKKKAMFLLEQQEKTLAMTERKWYGTDEGQREIELSHYSKATEKLISSLKSRLYELY